MNIEELIKDPSTVIVDVRTPEEFMGGHVAGSINIPLQEITARLDELKAIEGPFILCCASGGRSGQATAYLSQLDMECYNGGGWMDVNYYKSQNA